ncbi:HNH endonuclease [Arthrobacter sp. MA-N2]
MSTPDNLQTLCWRCNRTKSNKVSFAWADEKAAIPYSSSRSPDPSNPRPR